MDLERYRVLLLDRSFRPIRALNWRRAILLGLSDRVEVLETYDRVIRTPSRQFAMPAVIRARDWVERSPRTVALTRRNVILRDDSTCVYCGAAGSFRELTLDHVLPRSRGGRTSWDNLVAACGPCNRRKGDRTPAEAGMPMSVVPRVPSALSLGRRGMLVTGDPPPEWEGWLR